MSCLVGLIILLIALLVAYKMVPVRVKAADLRDTITDEARSAGTRSDKAITESIIYKAQQIGLPVTEDNIDVNRGGGMIRVEVKYVVPINFPGYTYNWHFHHKAENPIF